MRVNGQTLPANLHALSDGDSRVSGGVCVAALSVMPHVQKDAPRTCARPPLTHSELVAWAISNYAIDPIQNSKNRWRIRIRCRKVGCVHSDHIGLKTISFMDDSAYRRIARSKRKYADWKKQIKAENAGTLRKSD